MTPVQWEAMKHDVTDRMKIFTRPFVTPLGTETQTTVILVGTGSYVISRDQRILLTCEHVAVKQPMHHRFFGDDSVFEHRGPWYMDPHPIDAAFAALSDAAWQAVPHQAAAVPLGKFATKHQPSEQAELLFLRGFAGENADYGFGIHQTNGSSYCSQEKAGTGDAQIFEMFWEQENTAYSQEAQAEDRANVKFKDAHGLSGSLVWNTRFVEVTSKSGEWSPEDAVVTGLLRRWDEDTKTLLVWRVEHLNAWLASKEILP